MNFRERGLGTDDWETYSLYQVAHPREMVSRKMMCPMRTQGQTVGVDISKHRNKEVAVQVWGRQYLEE